MADKPFALSAKILILDERGRCLVLRRATGANTGLWDFPGGKLDQGEDLQSAMEREVAEETSLRVRFVRVLGAAESESPTARIAYLVMEARRESGEVRLSEEHDAHMWVEPSELPGVALCRHFQPFAKDYSRRVS